MECVFKTKLNFSDVKKTGLDIKGFKSTWQIKSSAAGRWSFSTCCYLLTSQGLITSLFLFDSHFVKHGAEVISGKKKRKKVEKSIAKKSKHNESPPMVWRGLSDHWHTGLLGTILLCHSGSFCCELLSVMLCTPVTLKLCCADQPFAFSDAVSLIL